MTGTDSSDWLGLSGRVCVVTGGGGGIGRATALSFAQAGARVAAIDLDERGLEVTRAELAQARRWPSRRPLRHHQHRECHRRICDDREIARALQRAGQHRGHAASRRARHFVACRMERGSRRQPDRLLPLRADFRPADAHASPRQSGSCGLDRRQQRAGAERRLQRQQGRRDHAVAATRQRMGTARHPQQRRQSRHGDHADDSSDCSPVAVSACDGARGIGRAVAVSFAQPGPRRRDRSRERVSSDARELQLGAGQSSPAATLDIESVTSASARSTIAGRVRLSTPRRAAPARSIPVARR